LWIAGSTETEREAELPLHLSNPESTTYSTPILFQEPQNTVWIEQKEREFATWVANVPILPRRTQNWQEPRTAEHDPTLRVAINALNKVIPAADATNEYLPPPLDELQKLEIRHLSATTAKLFAPQQPPPQWNAFGIKKVTGKNDIQYEFSLTGKNLPSTIPLVLRISGHGDGSALVTEGNVQKEPRNIATIRFSIPKEVFAMRSLQDEMSDMFVSIKPSLLLPEIPVGPIHTAQTLFKTSAPAVSVREPHKCSHSNEVQCATILISFSSLVTDTPAKVLLAPFTSKMPKSAAIILRPIINANTNSRDFEIELPLGKNAPQGVLGLIFQAENGEVLGRWAVANLTKNGIEAVSAHVEVASRLR
jgi:hypothetical protein